MHLVSYSHDCALRAPSFNTSDADPSRTVKTFLSLRPSPSKTVFFWVRVGATVMEWGLKYTSAPEMPSPLTTAELLAMILFHLEPIEAKDCLTVCKRWTEPALDVLWFSLGDIAPVLSLLRTESREQSPGEWITVSSLRG